MFPSTLDCSPRILISLLPQFAEITIVQVVGGYFCWFFLNEKCLVFLMKGLVNKIISLNLLLDFSRSKKSTFIISDGQQCRSYQWCSQNTQFHLTNTRLHVDGVESDLSFNSLIKFVLYQLECPIYTVVFNNLVELYVYCINVYPWWCYLKNFIICST